MEFRLFLTDKKSSARTGEIVTAHGVIPTPVFMPVGTVGAVKAVCLDELENDINASVTLSNTYHLYLRPGMDIIREAGGLHKFNGWNRPILTDSGGYQVFSLTEMRKLSKDGVIFKSHLDGSKHNFTPENVVDIQRTIGSDIMMVLDECTPYPCSYDYAKKSVDITHSWLARCMDRYRGTEGMYGYTQALFPIVQGSIYSDLRKKSAETIAGHDAPGNAIGGLSVGEPAEIMYKITSEVCAILPQHKPRYLMGVGTPANILECIALGVDMFDCVMPTRNARNGMIFTAKGMMNMKNEKWKNDFSLLDEEGASAVDTMYSKAFLRHMFVSKEMLAGMIATRHNLAFYMWLVREARKHILGGDYTSWKEVMVKNVSQKL